MFSHADFPDSPLTIENILFKFVSMGNPHAVGLVENISGIDISNIGPKIEQDAHFPNKINMELVEKVTDTYYRGKVWERGCGATLSCGTGACAVYAIVMKDCVRQPARQLAGGDLTPKEITLEFSGGNLYLSENQQGQIILRGPAVFVFKGEIE